MQSAFTGISKRKQKCYFQFCKGFGAVWLCTQLSLPKKHPTGAVSSEVLCKIMFITLQPVVASQSRVALAKRIACVRPQCPRRWQRFFWGYISCNSNWPCQCEAALFRCLSYCSLTCFGSHQIQDVFCCCCCTMEPKQDFCLLQAKADKCCLWGKQHSGLLDEIRVSTDIYFTLYILTEMTASNRYRILQGQILVYTHQIVFILVKLSNMKARVVSHHLSLYPKT